MLPSPSNLFLAHHQALSGPLPPERVSSTFPDAAGHPTQRLWWTRPVLPRRASSITSAVNTAIPNWLRASHPRWQLISPTAQRRLVVGAADCTPFSSVAVTILVGPALHARRGPLNAKTRLGAGSVSSLGALRQPTSLVLFTMSFTLSTASKTTRLRRSSPEPPRQAF